MLYKNVSHANVHYTHINNGFITIMGFEDGKRVYNLNTFEEAATVNILTAVYLTAAHLISK